ncbi:hypothetical protein [Granulicella arctica]|uniref:Uncharacterized protein n=1 Tax=Granulicella arctica TaxID=940613 RepID=A0A7Y9TJ19_9BACT|nr:hypothetical protein [Granulicella arctica]NYF77832.1 hypothetical protein [Granulicella arctica]
MQTNPELHRKIVQTFLDTKSVDFAAAGKAIAELGPALSLSDEPGDFFCGTMRTFFHCYRLPNPVASLEELEELRSASEL